MKKLIVISDSHMNTKAVEELLQEEADFHIHCGDHLMSRSEMEGWIAVAGNWDNPDQFPLEQILEIEGHRILILHGHTLFSSFRADPKALVKRARQNDCDVVLFGHTHSWFFRCTGGVYLMNPGSVWMNWDGSESCYAQVTVSKDRITMEKRLYRGKREFSDDEH